MKLRLFSTSERGFTLTEVLVSSALIVAIMALMLSTVDQTRRTIESTTARVTQFQSARIAFEAMTRNLGQATLNTYWDLDRDLNKNPLRFRRQSDLHFVSGRAFNPSGDTTRPSKFFGGGAVGGEAESENIYPGHAIFFQAPLGVTSAESGIGPTATRTFGSLSNLLSVVGYYVKWDKDESLPGFVAMDPEMVAERYRYRLMETLQPGETNMIYNNENYTAVSNLPAGGTKSPYKHATDWIQVALGRLEMPGALAKIYIPGPKQMSFHDYSRPLAENVVAMIILPKRAEHDRENPRRVDDLTQDFEYDSRPREAYQQQARELAKDVSADVVAVLKSRDKRLPRQLHQLPAIVQVTMVAIDDASAIKLQDWVVNQNGGTPPNWTDGLFKTVTTPEALLAEIGDPNSLVETSLIYKLTNPDRLLPTPRMNYRVFTTDVVMRGAKWSKDN